jgi:hypothetical protein
MVWLEFCRWRSAEASEAAALEEFPAARRIEGKVAVVTGASSGIGKTIVEHCRCGLTGWRRAANLSRVSWLPALTGRHEKGIR